MADNTRQIIRQIIEILDSIPAETWARAGRPYYQPAQIQHEADYTPTESNNR